MHNMYYQKLSDIIKRVDLNCTLNIAVMLTCTGSQISSLRNGVWW